MSLDPARPNVLWVSFEDTNPCYGCYGDPVARTLPVAAPRVGLLVHAREQSALLG